MDESITLKVRSNQYTVYITKQCIAAYYVKYTVDPTPVIKNALQSINYIRFGKPLADSSCAHIWLKKILAIL